MLVANEPKSSMRTTNEPNLIIAFYFWAKDRHN